MEKPIMDVPKHYKHITGTVFLIVGLALIIYTGHYLGWMILIAGSIGIIFSFVLPLRKQPKKRSEDFSWIAYTATRMFIYIIIFTVAVFAWR